MGEWKEKDARAETIEAGNREQPKAGSPVEKMEEGAKTERQAGGFRVEPPAERPGCRPTAETMERGALMRIGRLLQGDE